MSARSLTILGAAIFLLAASPAKPVKKDIQCSRSALQLKNCHLQFDSYAIQIWKEKMSVNDSISRDLVDLPLKGEKVEWVTGRIEKLNNDYFVEWIAWEEPSPQSDIQTKMWYVYRLNHEKAELVLSHPLVKRIKVENAKPKSDHEIDFGLRLETKAGSKPPVKEAIWYAGKEKGALK